MYLDVHFRWLHVVAIKINFFQMSRFAGSMLMWSLQQLLMRYSGDSGTVRLSRRYRTISPLCECHNALKWQIMHMQREKNDKQKRQTFMRTDSIGKRSSALCLATLLSDIIAWNPFASRCFQDTRHEVLRVQIFRIRAVLA